MTVAFDAALRDRSAAEIAAFVADLRSAGGWETAVDGATVTATRAAETRRLRVLGAGDADGVGGDRPDAAAFDAVVALADDEVDGVADAVDGADADVTVLKPADLYDRLAYGVPPEERAALVTQHFGVEEVAPPAGWDKSPDDALTDVHASAAVDSDSQAPSEATEGPDRSSTRTTPADAAGGRRADADDPPTRRDAGTVSLGGSTVEPQPSSAGRTPDAPDDGTDDGSEDGTPSRAVRVAVVVAVLLGGALGVVAVGPTPGGGGTADAPGAAGLDAPTSPTAGETATSVRRGQAAWTTAAPAEAGDRRYVRMEPTCQRPPALVVRIQVGALRQNDPETNDGVRTLWRFASYANKRFNKGYTGFVNRMTSPEYRPLYRYDRVTFGPVERDGVTASQQVTVAGPNGTATYEWGLVRRGDDGDGCWLTDGVARVDDGTMGSGATIYGGGGDGVDSGAVDGTTANGSNTATTNRTTAATTTSISTATANPTATKTADAGPTATTRDLRVTRRRRG